MTEEEFEKKKSLRNNVATLIAAFVCMISFLVTHQINVFSSHFGLAFEIPEMNVGIYFTKLNSLRCFLIMLGTIIEYIIYKSELKICIYMSSVTFCLMFIMRLCLLFIIYISRKVALYSYMIFIAEAFFFGAFQNTFYRLTPQYSRTTTLSAQVSGLLMFIIQCICDYYSYRIPILNVKIQYYISILTSAIALGLWIFYLFYFDKYFPLSINEETYKIDTNYSLITYQKYTEIQNEVQYITKEIEKKENETITLMKMNVPTELLKSENSNNQDIFDNILKILLKFDGLKNIFDDVKLKINDLEGLKKFIEDFSKFELNKFLERLKKTLKDIKELDMEGINSENRIKIADDHKKKTSELKVIRYDYFTSNYFVKKMNYEKISELITESDTLSNLVSSQQKNLFDFTRLKNQYIDTKNNRIIPSVEKIYKLIPEIFDEVVLSLIKEVEKSLNIFDDKVKLEKLIEQMNNIVEIRKNSHGLEKITDITDELLDLLNMVFKYCDDKFMEDVSLKSKDNLRKLRNSSVEIRLKSEEITSILNKVLLTNIIIKKINQNQINQLFNKNLPKSNYIIIKGINDCEIKKIEIGVLNYFKISEKLAEIKFFLEKTQEYFLSYDQTKDYSPSVLQEHHNKYFKCRGYKNEIMKIVKLNDVVLLKPNIHQLHMELDKIEDIIVYQYQDYKDKRQDRYIKRISEFSTKLEYIIEIMGKIILETKEPTKLSVNEPINDIASRGIELQNNIEKLELSAESYINYKYKEKSENNLKFAEQSLKLVQGSTIPGIEKHKEILEKIQKENDKIEKCISDLVSNTSLYYKSLIEFILDLLKCDLQNKSRTKSNIENEIKEIINEITGEIELIKQKLEEMSLFNQFLDCMSPFMMGIGASAIKNFIFPSILPYAFLLKFDCHLINKTTSLLLTFGSLTIFVLDKYIVNFREWAPSMNLFWLLILQQIEILIFTLLGIHTRIAPFRSLIGCKTLVLFLTMALLYFYSVMESTSYVAVANHVFYKSNNILGTVPILTYLNILEILIQYIFLKFSVGYNATRVKHGLVLPNFSHFIHSQDYTFCFWVKESIKEAFKDILLDLRLNIRDYT